MGNTCSNPIIADRRAETTTHSFESYLREKNRHVPQVGHIKLLTYNIFIRPPMISNNGDDYKDERLEEFAKLLKNYDIVCLQEMFSSYSSRKAKLVEKAKEAGLLFSVESPKVATFSAHFIDGGLLILSRYPIVESEFCPYPLGIGADYYVNKGALYAKIKIANSYLHLYTTHAQASYDLNPKYFLKRAEQFVAFQQFIKQSLATHNYTDEDLVLLTGDFNVDGRSQLQFITQDYISDPLFQGFTRLARTSVFSEYEALVSCLSDDHKDELEDILYKKLGEHPITFGDYYVTDKNERKPKDKVLTHSHCLCADESLDYIFKYVPKSLSYDSIRSPRLNVKQKLIVREENTGVDRFFVHGHDFDQLSDHYGVTVTLECVQNERDKEEAETVSGSAYENESPIKTTHMG